MHRPTMVGTRPWLVKVLRLDLELTVAVSAHEVEAAVAGLVKKFVILFKEQGIDYNTDMLALYNDDILTALTIVYSQPP